MSSELSLRHLPDLSDVSGFHDFSDSSFQIPLGAGSSNDFLLNEDTADFLGTANDTLSTPLPAHQRFLNSQTPKSSAKPRGIAVRSSLRLRAQASLATPLRAAVASGISAAIAEDISLEESFLIPSVATNQHGCLLDETNDALLDTTTTVPRDNEVEAEMRMEVSEAFLPPPPTPKSRQSPTKRVSVIGEAAIPQNERAQHPHVDNESSEASSVIDEAAQHAEVAAAKADNEPPQSPVTADTEPLVSAPIPKKATTLSQARKPTRRKSTVIAGGISKSKPKIARATVPRILSSSTSKPKPSMRANASQSKFPRRTRTNLSVPVKRAQPAPDAVPPRSEAQAESDARTEPRVTPVPGGLASALMSYGQRMITNFDFNVNTNAIGARPHHENMEYPNATPSLVGASSLSEPEPECATATAPGAASRSPSGLRGSGRLPGDSDRDRTLTVSHLARLPDIAPTASTTTAASVFECTVDTAETRFSSLGTDVPATTSDPHAPHLSTNPPEQRRPSAKRPAFAEDGPEQRKRSRTGPLVADKEKEDARAVRAEKAGPAVRTVRHTRAKTTPARALPGGAPHASADPHANMKELAISSSSPGSGSHGDAEQDGTNAGSGSRRQLTNTRAAGGHDAQKENMGGTVVGGKARRAEHKSIQSAAAQAHAHAHPAPAPAPAVPVPARTTRPIEFHFASDARVEARKAEQLEKSQGLTRSHAHAPLVAIPDFKAMHAQHDAALAARREQIVPIVPLNVEFATDVRAREREKFEEARRAREREVERQMEERRRQQELEEELEIRELRRRAVPKANEVPEWYAHAPKKGGPGAAAATGTGNGAKSQRS